jgi:hypothetical protein
METILCCHSRFSLPAVQRKKVTTAFDGKGLISEGSVMLLSDADRRLGLRITAQPLG